MEGKVLYVVLALVASSSAASISGMASIDLNQVSAGGQLTFPRIPGINSPLFDFWNPTQSRQNDTISQQDDTNTGIGSVLSHIPIIGNLFAGTNNRSRIRNSAPGNKINDFASAIPGLKNVMSGDFLGDSPFGVNIENLLSRIPKGANFTVPDFPELPDVNAGPYIPGLSEALREARQHLQAALNITGDISTGMQDAIHTALSSDHPADSIRIILNTIAKVYGTVAANCPLFIVGERVFNEGVRLAFEVVRSIGNIAVGPQNNIINSISSG